MAVAPTTPGSRPGAAAGRSCGRGSHGHDATASQPPLLHQLLTPAEGHGSADQNGKKKIGKTRFAPGIQETARQGQGPAGRAQQKAGASLEAHAQRHTHPSDLSPMHGRIGSEHASYFTVLAARGREQSYLARCSPSHAASADLHLSDPLGEMGRAAQGVCLKKQRDGTGGRR